MDRNWNGINTVLVIFHCQRFKLSKTFAIGVLFWWCNKSFSYARYVLFIDTLKLYSKVMYIIIFTNVYVF